MPLTPPPLRSTVSEQPDGLRISIPAPRKLYFTIFFLVWGAGWTYGGIETIRQTFVKHQGGLFNIIWLGMWAFFLVVFGHAWLWNLFGIDNVTVTSAEVRLRSELCGIGRTRAFAVSDMHNLRFIPEFGSGKSHRDSNIGFDYGAKTIKFAAGVEEAEANQLIAIMRSRAAISTIPSFTDYGSPEPPSHTWLRLN